MKGMVMGKPRAVVLGGKKFNISKHFHRHFEIVRHFEQDEENRLSSIQGVEIVLVLRDFVSHQAISKAAAVFVGVPIVAARNGWSHMQQELERRNLLPIPETPEVVEESESPQEAAVVEVAETAPVVDTKPETTPPAPAPEQKEPEQVSKIGLLIELLANTNGEITGEVSRMYREKFGEDVPSPIASNARKRLGLIVGRKKESDPVLPTGLNPFSRDPMLQAADRLVARRNELLKQKEQIDQEILKIDSDIKTYAPLIQHIEQYKMVQSRVKAELEKKAIQDRRVTGV